MSIIFYSFPGFQGLSYVHDLTSYSLSYVFIACRVQIRSLQYYFINIKKKNKVTHWRPTGDVLVIRNSRGSHGPPSQPDVYENTPEISNMMTMMAMQILAFILFA